MDRSIDEMDLSTLGKALLCGLAIDIAAHVALRVLSAFRPPRAESPNNAAVQVHFCPDDRQVCRSFLEGSCPLGDKCPSSHEATVLVHLVRVLGSARRSIDVCVYLLTCPQLGKVLIDRCRDGVVVRVITEACNADGNALQVQRLRSGGVNIRTNAPPALMHHKFAVVDGLKVITGSCNWTQQAISLNWENVVVSEVPDMVRPFIVEFQRLWDLFAPLSIVHGGNFFFGSHLTKFTKKKLTI